MLSIRDDEAEQDWVHSACTVKRESQQGRKHTLLQNTSKGQVIK